MRFLSEIEINSYLLLLKKKLCSSCETLMERDVTLRNAYPYFFKILMKLIL